MKKTENNLHIIQDGEKYGFADEQGKVVIPCTWKEVAEFREGLAPVCNDEEKWGYIDTEGNVAIPCEWCDVEFFKYGFARVETFNKHDFSYYIDTKGNIICSSVFYYPEVAEILESLKLAGQSKYKEAIEKILPYASRCTEDTSPLNMLITYSINGEQYETMKKLLDSVKPLDILCNYSTKINVGDVYRYVLKDYVKAYLWYQSALESDDDIISNEAGDNMCELINEHPEIKEDSRVGYCDGNVTYEEDFD